MQNYFRLKRFEKVKFIGPLALIDIIFFSFTNPFSSNSFIVIIACLLLALTLFAIFFGLAKLLATFVPLSGQVQKRLGAFMTLLILFLLLMQSVGQLSWPTVMVVVLLLFGLFAYLSYSSKGDNHSALKR